MPDASSIDACPDRKMRRARGIDRKLSSNSEIWDLGYGENPARPTHSTPIGKGRERGREGEREGGREGARERERDMP